MSSKKTVADCWARTEIIDNNVDNLRIRLNESQTAIRSDLKDLKTDIGGIQSKQIEMFNHQSSRIPKEYVDKLIDSEKKASKESSIKWSIVTGLIVSIVAGIAFIIIK